jgi:hypothetical protein
MGLSILGASSLAICSSAVRRIETMAFSWSSKMLTSPAIGTTRGLYLCNFLKGVKEEESHKEVI